MWMLKQRRETENEENNNQANISTVNPSQFRARIQITISFCHVIHV